MSRPDERLVGGMTCSDVLSVLSDFVDGDLDLPLRNRVIDHLRGCDWCERFGGHFRALVESLRGELREPEPLAEDVAARLRSAVERER